ncbi:MAG: NAD-dependent epimerase/dehydratase family protein [Gammaproteobacteria bacterium]|nr:NAD-dependent epimerase/dehydratase family protein [Gammaproteobacteria bacterium]MBU1446750.1 NAD-dependent epimerase/dehydratase family protein [Gammaproteobacteria bacterium]
MKVLVTGADGFVGKNLAAHLREIPDIELSVFLRSDTIEQLEIQVAEADFVFHLAGVNRPKEVQEYTVGNLELTQQLCDAIYKSNRPIPVVYTSSIQAHQDNPYGVSKLRAEGVLLELMKLTGSHIYVYRLPNLFGKWCRPNYNSVVATFCHNIANELPIKINDPEVKLDLVYIDDVIQDFLSVMREIPAGGYRDVQPVYPTSVGELATELQRFKDSRHNLITEKVGTGLTRALYSTYLSYLSPAQFAYQLVKHEDARGVFVEMLKTSDSGQFSYFTAHPGVTRGGHYHHTKNEKFLVTRGVARFRFQHLDSGEIYEYCVDASRPEIVETIPGWSHDITNIGEDEMIVLLWANEIFDRNHPDTYSKQLS